MHEPDSFAHGSDCKSGDNADNDGKNNDARLSRADNGAESVWDFERLAERTHQGQIQSSGRRHRLKFHRALSCKLMQTSQANAPPGGLAAFRARVFRRVRIGEPDQKSDQKSVDFCTATSLKNTAESTY
jgi:hypothetical protein